MWFSLGMNRNIAWLKVNDFWKIRWPVWIEACPMVEPLARPL